MQNGYTQGKDVSIDIMGPYGLISISKIMSFESKPVVQKETKTPLNGITDTLLTPQGWEGSFKVERTDSTLDDFWARWEDDYYNGVLQNPATITETIKESSGNVSVYRYDTVVLHLTEAGSKEGLKTISQTMSFTAARRRKVA